jgi:hypothetical protein
LAFFAGIFDVKKGLKQTILERNNCLAGIEKRYTYAFLYMFLHKKSGPAFIKRIRVTIVTPSYFIKSVLSENQRKLLSQSRHTDCDKTAFL